MLATVTFLAIAIAAALGLGKGAILALVGQRVRCAGRLGDWRGLHRLVVQRAVGTGAGPAGLTPALPELPT